MTDPEQIVHRIRSIQQELVQMQHKVIQGEIGPEEYKRIEEDRVKKIHELEAEMARATGQPEPERDSRL